MLFHSYIFILVFLPAVLVAYYMLNRMFPSTKPALWFLTMASQVFYGYGHWSYVLILAASIAGNWLAVMAMRRQKKNGTRKMTALAAIAFDIALIFYYKYFDFFIGNINALCRTDFPQKNLLLPLGISFFTFQQISFIADSYRHETDDYTLTEYAAFVSFFPQLVAGPIVLHDEMIPQLRDASRKKFSWEKMARGLFLFSTGLFKKVLIADTFGAAADWGYANTDAVSSMDAGIVILSYALQIYFDFSGYCDMASGIASMFHLELPLNFDSPYQALSITGFWQRWHMTLTRFLRKYIYFPLGGSRKGKARTYGNIMAVFLISGIWHGAGWTFVLWGALHGAAQCLNRIFQKQWEQLHAAVQWAGTFVFVSYAWVIFRAENLSQALKIIWRSVNFTNMTISPELKECFDITEVRAAEHLLGWKDTYYVNGFVMFLWLAAAMHLVLNVKNAQKRCLQYSVKSAACTAVLLVWGIISLSGVSAFLYFNF